MLDGHSCPRCRTFPICLMILPYLSLLFLCLTAAAPGTRSFPSAPTPDLLPCKLLSFMANDLLDMSSQPLCDPDKCKWCEAKLLLSCLAGPVPLLQSLSHSTHSTPLNHHLQPSCTCLLHPLLPPTPTIITELATLSPLLAHASLHCQVRLLETPSSPDQKPPRAPSALRISGAEFCVELVGLSCPACFPPSTSTNSPLWANCVASVSLSMPSINRLMSPESLQARGERCTEYGWDPGQLTNLSAPSISPSGRKVLYHLSRWV